NQQFYNVIYNGTGSTWTLQDSFNQGSTGGTTFTTGTLTLNGMAYNASKGQTVTLGSGFTLNIGSGAVNTNGNMSFNVPSGAAVTITTGSLSVANLNVSGTGTFTCSGNSVIISDYNTTITSPNWTPSTSTLFSRYGTSNINITQPLYNYTIGLSDSYSPVVTLLADLIVQNNFTINAGTGGTKTFNAGSHTIYVGNNWSNTGVFNCGTGTVILNGNGTGKTINTGGYAFNTLTIDSPAATGYWTLITNNLSAADLNITNGTLDVGAGKTITVSGTLTIENGSSIRATANNINIVANSITQSSGYIHTITSGDITINSIGTPGAFFLNAINASGSGSITIGNSLASSSVTVDASIGRMETSSGNINIASSGDITTYGGNTAINSDSGNITLTAGGDVILGTASGYGDTGTNSGTVTVTAVRDVTVDYYTYLYNSENNILVDAGRDINIVTRVAGEESSTYSEGASVTLYADRNININGRVYSYTGSVTFYADHDNDGVGVYNHTGGSVSTQGAGNNITIYSAGSSHMFNTSSGASLILNPSVGQTVTYIADNCTLTVPGILTVNSGVTLRLGGSNTTLNNTGGSVSNNGRIQLEGNEVLTGVTNLDINSGIVEYIGASGSTTYTIRDFGTTDYFDLIINGILAETFNLNTTNALTMAGSLTLSGGTITQGTGVITVRGDMTLSSGVSFTKNASGLIIFASGSATQKLTSADKDLGNVRISANTTNTTLTLQDALNADNITIDAGQTLSTGTGSYAISCAGNWTNSGTFTRGTGTVTFDGDAPGKTINISSSGFWVLTINSPAGTGSWTLDTSNLTAVAYLNVTKGTLNTGTRNLGNGSGTAIYVNGGILTGGSGIIIAALLNVSSGTFTAGSGGVELGEIYGTSGIYIHTGGTADWTTNNALLNWI
ncbi:MAG: hypothetical protein WCT15_07655, partial [Candidatus Omnitrophota bacterium]